MAALLNVTLICSCLGEDDLLSSVQIAGNAINSTRFSSSVLLQMLSRPLQQHSIDDQCQWSGDIIQLCQIYFIKEFTV